TAGKVVGRAALAEGIGAGGVVRSHARALRALAPERFAGNDGGAVAPGDTGCRTGRSSESCVSLAHMS
ncbi:MAG TPA: hypothetical protein VK163_14975, partial [Opitutaceae bacterium]|nr:hypothetical protein [Opitutaceae bacterium]